MSRPVVKSPRARVDLLQAFVWIGERGGVESGRRFLRAVDSPLDRITRSPGIGALHVSPNPRLDDLRCCPVSRFKSYLLFYRVAGDRIDLVRVLHGARDIATIPGAEGED